MNIRRILTFVAATLITVGQTLIFAADTAASAEALLASSATGAKFSAQGQKAANAMPESPVNISE